MQLILFSLAVCFFALVDCQKSALVSSLVGRPLAQTGLQDLVARRRVPIQFPPPILDSLRSIVPQEALRSSRLSSPRVSYVIPNEQRSLNLIDSEDNPEKTFLFFEPERPALQEIFVDEDNLDEVPRFARERTTIEEPGNDFIDNTREQEYQAYGIYAQGFNFAQPEMDQINAVRVRPPRRPTGLGGSFGGGRGSGLGLGRPNGFGAGLEGAYGAPVDVFSTEDARRVGSRGLGGSFAGGRGSGFAGAYEAPGFGSEDARRIGGRGFGGESSRRRGEGVRGIGRNEESRFGGRSENDGLRRLERTRADLGEIANAFGKIVAPVAQNFDESGFFGNGFEIGSRPTTSQETVSPTQNQDLPIVKLYQAADPNVMQIVKLIKQINEQRLAREKAAAVANGTNSQTNPQVQPGAGQTQSQAQFPIGPIGLEGSAQTLNNESQAANVADNTLLYYHVERPSAERPSVERAPAY